MRQQYVDKLIGMMGDLDAMLICPSEELKFFTGFSPMMCERFQGLFIKKDGTVFYLCNLLYAGEIEKEMPGIPIYTWFDCDGLIAPVGDILRQQGLLGCKVGVNSSAQAFNILELMDKLDITFVNAKPLLEELRINKTEDELQRLRESAAIADSAYEPVLKFIRPGLTEGEVGDFLCQHMAAQGGTNMWVIVASGPNSSYPHYMGRDRLLQKGDCIVLDWGCEYKEMQSDMSRTVFLGSATEEQKEAYAISLAATLKAEEMSVEGAWIPDIDEAARAVLRTKGYDKTLINRTGHGIGYMGHEAPDIKTCNERKLERGMCFSIEPGVYLPGNFGLRVEDIVAINLQGETEILNKSRREMIIIEA